MPDDHKSQLLASWMEGTLTPQQREEFEQLCVEDPVFSQQVAAANSMLVMAENYEAEPVPDWDAEATFSAPQKPHWWQWQGLPALSFASSALAIVMVLTGVEVSVDEGSLTVSFAGKDNQQQVEQLVQAKLQAFQLEQQKALNTYAQSLQQQQLDASTQLTNYLLSSSRQERREDFAEFIKFINQQRSDDQQFYARQLNKLEREIYTGSGQTNWSENRNENDLNE